MTIRPSRIPLFLCIAAFRFASIASAGEPEIWFAPEDSIRSAQRGDPWKSEFMELFSTDAPWPKAAAHVQVFEIYPQFLSQSSDEELRTVIEGLKRRNIALAISYGMLHRPKGAEMHEGYGAELAERDIAKLQRLGADVRYVVADEPLLFGHFFWGEGAPPLPIADLAKDFVSTARLFRKAFPKVRFGMDDPIMLYKDAEWAPAMREFLEAYRRELGEPMDFVRLECASFQVREWLPRYLAARELFFPMGVKLGMLVTGDASDPSDAQWLARAEQRYVTWESAGRAAPDQVVFQSWMPRPSKILPEENTGTFTHLVNGYFRDRTNLVAHLDADHLRGHLTDGAGHPLAGVPVAFTILPGFSDPKMDPRGVDGVTPVNAQFMQVGLRIGMEGSRAGRAHLTIGSISYEQTGAPTEPGHSAAFNFLSGLKAWGKQGNAEAEIRNVSGEDKLEIDAAPGQTFFLNSKLVPIQPDRPFVFEFQARVHPETETGYFAIFFFDAYKKFIVRLTEPLVPENPRLVQKLTTDSEGNVDVPVSDPEWKGARELRLNYPGDDRRRPAFATLHPAP